MLNLEDINTYHDGIIDWVTSQEGEVISPKAKGDAFCQWCLENIFEMSEDDAIDAREVSGSYDYGIDAIFSLETEQRIIILQCKYETSHQWDFLQQFHYKMLQIQRGKFLHSEMNSNAQRAIARIRTAYDENWKVQFYYATSATFTENEKTKCSSLEGINHDFFALDLEGIATYLDKKQQDIPDTIDNQWFILRLSNREILTGDKTAVIAVSLSEIHDFVEKGGDSLFASNVRNYLRSTKINTEIKKTIQNTPDRFWLYNNGITVVCDDFMEENFSIKILTPQIVNGCQTARSIWDVLSRKSEQERRKIDGNVLVRIIQGADDTEKQNITRYTNSQNAVKGKDFFSLEDFHKKLQERFKKLKYYYEKQRGAYTALKSSERSIYTGAEALKYLVDSKFKNVIPALDAAQAYTSAFVLRPDVAYGKPNELSPNGSWYDNVFTSTLKPDPKLFLYPFLVKEWAKKNKYSRGGTGWRAHTAHFFVYAYFLMLMEITTRLDIVETPVKSPHDIPISVLDTLFSTAQINQQVLEATNDVLDRYFSDSKVEEDVGQDVRKYLKKQEILTKYETILRKQIEKVLYQRDAYLLEQIYQLLSSDISS